MSSGQKSRTLLNYPQMKIRGARRRKEAEVIFTLYRQEVRRGIPPTLAWFLVNKCMETARVWRIPDDPEMKGERP